MKYPENKQTFVLNNTKPKHMQDTNKIKEKQFNIQTRDK